MPFFAGASNFTVSGGEMNDIAGNQTKTETVHTTNNTNSKNTTRHVAKNSHNDSSKRIRGIDNTRTTPDTVAIQKENNAAASPPPQAAETHTPENPTPAVSSDGGPSHSDGKGFSLPKNPFRRSRN